MTSHHLEPQNQHKVLLSQALMVALKDQTTVLLDLHTSLKVHLS